MAFASSSEYTALASSTELISLGKLFAFSKYALTVDLPRRIPSLLRQGCDQVRDNVRYNISEAANVKLARNCPQDNVDWLLRPFKANYAFLLQ